MPTTVHYYFPTVGEAWDNFCQYVGPNSDIYDSLTPDVDGNGFPQITLDNTTGENYIRVWHFPAQLGSESISGLRSQRGWNRWPTYTPIGDWDTRCYANDSTWFSDIIGARQFLLNSLLNDGDPTFLNTLLGPLVIANFRVELAILITFDVRRADGAISTWPATPNAKYWKIDDNRNIQNSLGMDVFGAWKFIDDASGTPLWVNGHIDFGTLMPDLSYPMIPINNSSGSTGGQLGELLEELKKLVAGVNGIAGMDMQIDINRGKQKYFVKNRVVVTDVP